MDLTFWTQEWPVIRNAPYLAIGGAIVIALAVWAFVSWAYRRKIAVLKAEIGAWESIACFGKVLLHSFASAVNLRIQISDL